MSDERCSAEVCLATGRNREQTRWCLVGTLKLFFWRVSLCIHTMYVFRDAAHLNVFPFFSPFPSSSTRQLSLYETNKTIFAHRELTNPKNTAKKKSSRSRHPGQKLTFLFPPQSAMFFPFFFARCCSVLNPARSCYIFNSSPS